MSELAVGIPTRSPLRGSVYRVLARLGGAGVFELFEERFGRRFVWVPTIDSLTKLGDVRAVPLLEAKLVELVGGSASRKDTWPMLEAIRRGPDASDMSAIAELVAALARFGRPTRSGLLEALYTYPRASRELREECARAASVAVDAGTFELACAGLRDPDEHVRYAFVEALYFLGVRGVVGALAEVMATRGDSTSDGRQAAWRLEQLTGTDDLGSALALGATFAPGVCHRRGEPIDYVRLVRESASINDFLLSNEVELRLGTRLGAPEPPLRAPAVEVMQHEAEAWLATNGARFERGGHYRFATRIDLA